MFLHCVSVCAVKVLSKGYYKAAHLHRFVLAFTARKMHRNLINWLEVWDYFSLLQSRLISDSLTIHVALNSKLVEGSVATWRFVIAKIIPLPYPKRP